MYFFVEHSYELPIIDGKYFLNATNDFMISLNNDLLAVLELLDKFGKFLVDGVEVIDALCWLLNLNSDLIIKVLEFFFDDLVHDMLEFCKFSFSIFHHFLGGLRLFHHGHPV